ncbi:MAG: PadR family transcriptional regulator [Longimicrobiales bacterium]
MSGSDLSNAVPLSPTDFHVLLVLAEEDLYGYAILKAVEEESSGAVRPEIGSLYRVLARLMASGLLQEVEPPADAPRSSRGRPRRYYHLTDLGARVLEADIRRLEQALALARARRASKEAPA